ncbi:MAG: polyprenyl synthetase family protein [Dehalococcoidales bacterium]|nr:polyprenyl synthetase family protein [Dehalococcoidales bacterium]
MNATEAFARYRSDIDAELKSVLDGRRLPLYDMMRYHLGWNDERGNPQPCPGGKALRPTLCLLACDAVGGDYRKALPAAAALEFVHNFSLIHDDIQDDDKERRHRPTVWSIWGKPQAINAGSAMHILANASLSRLGAGGIPLDKQVRAQQIIDSSCLSLIEGQYLDISFETRLDITTGDYLDMVGKKTAALIAASLEVGALLGTDDPSTIEKICCIGWNIGLAFQIKDDILGIWGDAQHTGKTAYGDIIRKKKSFPVIYALDRATGQALNELVDFYSNGVSSRDAVGRVVNILENLDSQAESQKMAGKYRDDALVILDGLSIPEQARRELRAVFDFLVVRNF